MMNVKYYKASNVAIELGHSPLPWSVVDFAHKSGSEISAINIDCNVPRGGGQGMTVAELYYYKSWQDDNVPRSVVEANAELIVKSVNQHATLVVQRDRLLRLLRPVTSPTACYCAVIVDEKCWHCEARDLITAVEQDDR